MTHIFYNYHMDKPIHLALRYNPSGNVDLLGFKPDLSQSTIQHHIDIAKVNDYVWWGKMGKEGFGQEKLNQLKNQISKGIKTYAYLFELSSISYKAEILELTQDITDVEIDKIPEYYRDAAADLCELYLKLNNFEEQDRVEAITTLTLANNPDSLGGFHNALRGQSSRFYVIEGDTSLKEVFDYANTYKDSLSEDQKSKDIETLLEIIDEANADNDEDININTDNPRKIPTGTFKSLLKQAVDKENLEGELVKEYKSYLESEGYEADHYQIDIIAKKNDDTIFVEAKILKGKTETVAAQGLGQLLLYQYLKGDGTESLQMLFNRKPKTQIIEFIKKFNVKIVYKDTDSFIEA